MTASAAPAAACRAAAASAAMGLPGPGDGSAVPAFRLTGPHIALRQHLRGGPFPRGTRVPVGFLPDPGYRGARLRHDPAGLLPCRFDDLLAFGMGIVQKRQYRFDLGGQFPGPVGGHARARR